MTGTLIYLRAVEPEDIDVLYRWENDPNLWPLGNHPEPLSRFTLEQYVLNTEKDIYSARQLRLMIVEMTTNQAIGAVDLFDFEPVHSRAGIGILIDEPFRKKGYAAETLELILEYCFSTLNLHQLYCNISEDNTVSINLFQKAGFEICAIKKDWLLNEGQWKNELFLQRILP
jgi:diamine N-acetyltransferase